MNNIKLNGKLITKTFKQIEQERLLKNKVLPASGLAKRKQEVIEGAEAFSRAALDGEFVNRAERLVSPNYPSPIGRKVGVVRRELLEEQS